MISVWLQSTQCQVSYVSSFVTDCIRGIKEEGMPIYRHPEMRGNLYIKFEIEFPESGDLSEQAVVVSSD